MPTRTYQGPYEEVTVPLADGSAITCKHGETVEIPDEDIAGLNEEIWVAPKAAAKAKKESD